MLLLNNVEFIIICLSLSIIIFVLLIKFNYYKYKKILTVIRMGCNNYKNTFYQFILSIFTILLICLMYFFGINYITNQFIYEIFYITPIVILITMMPLGFNGVGIREYASIYFYTKYNIDVTSIFSVSLLISITMFISSLPGLFFIYSKKSIL